MVSASWSSPGSVKVTVTRVARVRRGRVPLEDASDATARVTSSGRGSRPRASAARAFRSPATTRASVATTEYPSATAAPRCSRSAWGFSGSTRRLRSTNPIVARRGARRPLAGATRSRSKRRSGGRFVRRARQHKKNRHAPRAFPKRPCASRGGRSRVASDATRATSSQGSAPGPSLATARAHLGTRVRPQPRASRRAFDLRVGAARGIRGVALVETSWLVASAG